MGPGFGNHHSVDIWGTHALCYVDHLGGEKLLDF